MIVKGVVNNKANKFDKHAIVVDGGTGLGELWYSSKFEINCQIGDLVEFDSGPEGKKWCSKLKVLSSGNPVKDKEGNVRAASEVNHSSGGITTTSTNGGSGGKGFGEPKMDRQRMIVRQNALTNAVAFHQSCGDLSTEEVISTAKLFEAYTTGDADFRAMKERAAKQAAEVAVAEEEARKAAMARQAEAPTEAPPTVTDDFDQMFGE